MHCPGNGRELTNIRIPSRDEELGVPLHAEVGLSEHHECVVAQYRELRHTEPVVPCSRRCGHRCRGACSTWRGSARRQMPPRCTPKCYSPCTRGSPARHKTRSRRYLCRSPPAAALAIAACGDGHLGSIKAALHLSLGFGSGAQRASQNRVRGELARCRCRMVVVGRREGGR